MVSDMHVNKNNMLKMAQSGYSTATDLADWLVKNLAMPFRKAHHVTGQIVKLAEEKNVELCDLELEEMQKIEPEISEKIFAVLTVEDSVSSRKSIGGTSPLRVAEEIVKAKNFKI